MKNDWLTPYQLDRLGFRLVGKDVRLSGEALVFNPANVILHDGCRIDAFSILSAGYNLDSPLQIGRFSHVAAGVYLYSGEPGISIGDFTGIGARTVIHATSDDFRETGLCGPCVPEEFRKVKAERVIIGNHVMVGAGCVILPGTRIGDGAVVGSMGFVKGGVSPGSVYVGNPLRCIGTRELPEIQEMERKFLESIGQ